MFFNKYIEEKENFTLLSLLETNFTAKISPELKAELVLLKDKGAKNFIIDHWHENGGFTGTLVDECTDCEYTFYAVMALGALADD